MAKKHKKEHSRIQAQPPAKDRFPAWLVWPVFAAWSFFVLKSYYGRFPMDFNSLFVILSPEQYTSWLFSVLPGHLLNIFLAAAFLFSCFSLGRLALRSGGFKFSGVLEETVFSCGTGLGLLASYVFILAVFKALYAWPVAAFLTAGGTAGIADLRRHPLPVATGPRGFGAADLTALGVLMLALLLNLVGTLSPEIFYDALVYHLAVPGFYVIKHGITRMPFNFYSDLPFTHGMLYAAALLVKGEILAKFLNYLAGALTAGAVIAMGARWFSLRTGLWGAAIFYTVGHAMLASWSAGTEALLMLFSTLALYAALLRSDEEMRWFWLAAAFSGLAMGVKYTGFFTAVGVMLIYVLAAWHSGRAGAVADPAAIKTGRPFSALKNLALFTLIASVFVGPWLIKNYLYTGNPVFPFLSGLLGTGPMSDPVKLKNFIANASQMGPFNIGTWFMTPWNVTMGHVGNSEYFSPLFLLLLPAAFLLGAPAGAAFTGLWVFFLAIWGGWSVSSTMVRFLTPAYPAAGLIMAAYLFSPGHKALKASLKVIVLAGCITGVYWAGVICYMQGRWKPVTGAVGKDEYLSHTQPTYPYSAYSAIKFINENTAANAKVMFVGDERSFYLKRDFIVSSVYDRTAIVEYAAAAKDGDDLYARLKADGITHLLLNVAEAIRLGRDYRMFYWDERARNVFYDFWGKHVSEAFAYEEQEKGRAFNRVAVYTITEQVPPGSPPPFNMMKEIIMKNIDAR